MNVDTNQRPPMTNQDGTAFNDNNLSNNTEPFTGTRTQRTYRNKVVDKGKRRNTNLRTRSDSRHTAARIMSEDHFPIVNGTRRMKSDDCYYFRNMS